MIQTLQRKKAIKEVGAVKGEKGKYLRVFRPLLNRQDYCSQQLRETVDTKSIRRFSQRSSATQICRMRLKASSKRF